MIESPATTKTASTLELHSPNAFNMCQNNAADTRPSPRNSPVKSQQMRGKGSSSPSSYQYTTGSRMTSSDEDDCDEENTNKNDNCHHRECRGGKDALPFSPIVRHADLFSPRNMSVSAMDDYGANATTLPFGDERRDDDDDDYDDYDDVVVANYSFPVDDGDVIDIQCPDNTIEGDHDDDEEVTQDEEETDEERTLREIAESEALARQLMAEEAMASYAMSTEFLRQNADQFSSEDLAALRAAMAEEDPENIEGDHGEDDDDHGDDDGGNDSDDLSYDELLRLGERIGDVKEERWALIAHDKIRQLPTLLWNRSMADGREENHTLVKCQVCQFPYEEDDELRRLPCEHYFHRECVDSWLSTKDTCALCRKPIC